ncbi:unnamed protein product [Acanthosepion pharaonis]|uniref:Reverse transcriptase domain-containing protein n=1 Tax=Acanthosepion pharaonis TaxID=158019 RepID=A0A812CP78_ACAPH|nr:unnamed protein product [Sepia pharaonis]
MYQTHPNQWNELKKRRDASYRSHARTYVRWTIDDLRRMAALEREALSFNVHNINTYIGSCRSSDQISCRRQLRPCPGPDGAQPQVVLGESGCDLPPRGPHRLVQWPPWRGLSASGLAPRLVLTSAPPGTTDADLAPLLTGRTIIAIRSKRRRLPRVSTLVGNSDPAPQDPPDEEPDKTEARPSDDVQHDDSRGIVEYINGLLPLISNTNIRNKAELALSEPDGFSLLFYEVFPKNRTRNRRSIPPVKTGIWQRRRQRSAIYKFLQRLHSRSPKSVVERLVDSDLSYEGLVAERSFSEEDFLRKWKPVFERDCFADLARDHPTNSFPHPRVRCRLRPCVRRPPGAKPVIFSPLVTFIKKVEVPGDPLEFRLIATGNYFVRVFHRVLASRFEASLPDHQDQAGFQRLDEIAHNVLKLHAAISEARNKNENLVVASVDIRKAFDSLSHKALLGILRRKGVPDLLLHYFRSYFSSIRLQIGMDLIHPVHRGVKQGDPLAP